MDDVIESCDLIKPERVYSTGAVAKVCQVAMRTAAKWIDSGILVGYRVPGCLARRVRRVDLLKFMKEHGIPLTVLDGEECFNVLTAGCDDGTRDVFAGVFTQEGSYYLTQRDTIASALVAIEDHPPDAIVLDGSNGMLANLEAASALFTHYKSTRSIWVGCLLNEDCDDPCKYATKFSAVYRKPFNVREIGKVLRDLATNKFSQAQLVLDNLNKSD